MRHGRALRKLGRTTEHRLSLLRNLSTSFFRSERITTTLHKAKEVRPFAEKLITLARQDTLHSRRLAARDIQDRDVLKKLFNTLGPRFSQRPGGYSRILKLGWRQGDGAELAILELLGSEPNFDKGPKKRKKASKGAKEETARAAGEKADAHDHEAHDKPEAAASGQKKAVAKPLKKPSGTGTKTQGRGKKKPGK